MRLRQFPIFQVVLGACIAALLAASAARAARAQSGGVEMTAEPHHRLVLENDYIRVFDVHIAAKDATQRHWHHRDDFWIGFGDARLANDVTGSPEATVASRDGDVHFSRGGYTHVVRNLGRLPFHNLTIELKMPQGTAENLCGHAVLGGAPMAAPDATPCAASPAVAPLFHTSATSLERIDISGDGPVTTAALGEGRFLIVALDPLIAGDTHMLAGNFLWIEGRLPALQAGPARAHPARLLVFRFE